ncbi:hypothetical protein METHB2_50075 [Candidatus Methylobacter favarea]|uniref:Uncharacterized protein n=1 Tax=Candidatus Methylobacter favarea TaxID=2707345 RepID=A0A8S0X934_9GAMM|nr:hypothetical protein METHB2_50075 [Candidatus Methylobacter favarea]
MNGLPEPGGIVPAAWEMLKTLYDNLDLGRINHGYCRCKLIIFVIGRPFI